MTKSVSVQQERSSAILTPCSAKRLVRKEITPIVCSIPLGDLKVMSARFFSFWIILLLSFFSINGSYFSWVMMVKLFDPSRKKKVPASFFMVV